MKRFMKRCKKKYIKLSILLMCIISFYSCNSSVDNSYIEAHSGYDNEILKPRIKIYQEKNLVISAQADKLIKDEGEDAILVGNVISDFFDDDGKHMSTLYSDSAIVEKISNNLTAFGSVRVEADSGRVFSDKILWNNQYKLISSNDTTLFTSPAGDTINCVGFESDVDLTNMEFMNTWGKIFDRKKK